MGRKITQNEVIKFSNEYGFDVLDEYINIKTKMHFICKNCKSLLHTSFDNFKVHHNCRQCGDKKSRTIYSIDVVKDFLFKRDVCLLETKWDKGVFSTVRLNCLKCNHEFIRVFNNFKDNPTCPVCRKNSRKFTYDQVKNYVEIESNSGCLFLETEETYNIKRKIEPRMACCKFDIQCVCGNVFNIDFNTFKSGGKRQCNQCTYNATGAGLKYSYEDIKQYIEVESQSGCILLSTEYKGNHKPLHIQCSCGNDFYRALAVFKGRNLFKCQKCTGAKVPHTTESIKVELEEYNIKLLSDYIRFHENIKIQYECGYVVERSIANIRKSNYICPHCNKKGYGRNTEIFKDEILQLTHGEYELLSDYKTMNDHVLMKHTECGHEWNITPHNFIDSKNRCPVCNNSKGELRIYEWLSEREIENIRQFQFDDLKGDYDFLKFDFAIFKNGILKLLIEYDGEFHYMPIKGEEQLQRQKRYDSLKDQYCNNHNIKLLRIPYWEFDNIEKILEENLL